MSQEHLFSQYIMKFMIYIIYNLQMIQVRERVGGQEALPREDVFTPVARAGKVQGRLRHVDLAQGGEEGDSGGGGGRQGGDKVLPAVTGFEAGENSENVR